MASNGRTPLADEAKRPQDIPQEVGDDVEGFVPVPQVHEGFAQEPQDGWAAMPTQMESAFPQGRHVSFAEQMGIPEQSYQTVVYGAAEMSNLRHSMGMEMPMGMGGEFLQGQAMGTYFSFWSLHVHSLHFLAFRIPRLVRPFIEHIRNNKTGLFVDVGRKMTGLQLAFFFCRSTTWLVTSSDSA